MIKFEMSFAAVWYVGTILLLIGVNGNVPEWWATLTLATMWFNIAFIASTLVYTLLYGIIHFDRRSTTLDRIGRRNRLLTWYHLYMTVVVTLLILLGWNITASLLGGLLAGLILTRYLYLRQYRSNRLSA